MTIKLIFKYYWPHFKKYAKSNIFIFVSYGLAVVGSGIVAPILYKQIIDIVSSTDIPTTVSAMLIKTVLVLGLVLIFYNLFFRLADYAMTYAQSHMLKDVADDAFQRIFRHSYDFFSNTFAGSLVAKTRRYVRSLEQIHDQIVFSGWMNGLRLVFGIAVLIYFSFILGTILLIWLVLYIGISALFVKKKV